MKLLAGHFKAEDYGRVKMSLSYLMEPQDVLGQIMYPVLEMVCNKTRRDCCDFRPDNTRNWERHIVKAPTNICPTVLQSILSQLFHRCPRFLLVICARGKAAQNHPGNKFFRSVISKMHESYKQADTKLQRSIVVSEVVDMIRSKGMGFVKKESSGKWGKY